MWRMARLFPLVATGRMPPGMLPDMLRWKQSMSCFGSVRLGLDQSQVAEKFAGCDLYVTCEPCIMCATALSIIGIREVYFGCANDKFGGCGSIMSFHKSSSSDDLSGCGNKQQHIESYLLMRTDLFILYTSNASPFLPAFQFATCNVMISAELDLLNLFFPCIMHVIHGY